MSADTPREAIYLHKFCDCPEKLRDGVVRVSRATWACPRCGGDLSIAYLLAVEAGAVVRVTQPSGAVAEGVA